MWLDARDLVPGSVASWTDRASALPFTNGAGLNQPTATAGQTPAGTIAVKCDPTGGPQGVRNATLPVLGTRTTYTVARPVSGATFGLLIDSSAGIGQRLQTSGVPYNLRWAGNLAQNSGFTVSTDAWHTMAMRINQGVANSYHLDGATAAPQAGETGTQTGLTVGAVNNVSFGGECDYAAVLQYDRVLTLAELGQLDAWAADVFGV